MKDFKQRVTTAEQRPIESLAFTYVDDEGDVITLQSDSDLDEALRLATALNKPLKVTSRDCNGSNEVPDGFVHVEGDELRGKTFCEERWPSNPKDLAHFDTERMRGEFLVPHANLMVPDQVHFVYSHCDRLVLGGCNPVSAPLSLETVDPLRAEYFLERREMCVWNVGGGDAVVTVEGTAFTLKHTDCLYIAKGSKVVTFASSSAANSAHLYLVSTLAYDTFTTKVVSSAEAKHEAIGSAAGASVRDLYQYVIPGVCDSSQICTGMTVVQGNSVWNTMPCHTHARRTEAYLYFDLPEKMSGSDTNDNRICHLLGPPQETRCLWMSNEEAVIATPGFIHCAAGTQAYAFIWTMAGENPFAFSDMDSINPGDLE